MRATKTLAAAALLTLVAGCAATQDNAQNEDLILLGASTGGYVAGRAGAILITEQGSESDFRTVSTVLNGVNALLKGDGFATADLQTQLDSLPYGLGQDVGFVLQRWAPLATQFIDRDSLAFRATVAAMDGFGLAFRSPTEGLATASHAAHITEPVPQKVIELRALLRQ